MATIVKTRHRLGAKGMSARLQRWADYRFLDTPSIWGGFSYNWSPAGVRVRARGVCPAEIRWTETEISVFPRKDVREDFERAFWAKELARIAEGTLPAGIAKILLPTEGRPMLEVKAHLNAWLKRVTGGKFVWGGDGNTACFWYQNPDGSEIYGILTVSSDKLHLEVRDPGPARRGAHIRQWTDKLRAAIAKASPPSRVGEDDGKSKKKDDGDRTALWLAGAAAVLGVGVAIAASDKHDKQRR